MTRLFRRLLLICSVALVGACGSGSDDVVIRTDADQAGVAGHVTVNGAEGEAPGRQTGAPRN